MQNILLIQKLFLIFLYSATSSILVEVKSCTLWFKGWVTTTEANSLQSEVINQGPFVKLMEADEGHSFCLLRALEL